MHGLAHLLRFGGSSRIYRHCSIEHPSSSLYVPVYRRRRMLLDVVSSSHHAAPCASSLRIGGRNCHDCMVGPFFCGLEVLGESIIELLSNSLCVPTYRWRRKLLDVVSYSYHAGPYASPELLRIWGKLVIIAWIAHFLWVGDSVSIYDHRSIELVNSSLCVHMYRWRRMLLDVVSPSHHAAPCASEFLRI